MKCPYAVNRIIIRKSTVLYDTEGRQNGYDEMENNKASFVNCLEEECGAYQNGKCRYKGSD